MPSLTNSLTAFPDLSECNSAYSDSHAPFSEHLSHPKLEP